MSLERTQRRAQARQRLKLALLVLKQDPSLNGQPARFALAGNGGAGARRRLKQFEAKQARLEAQRLAEETVQAECEFSEGDM